MKRKILILGGSYMNLQMKIDPRTKDNNLTTGGEYRFHPYGEAAVAAITVAKLGGECVFGTKFGDDTNGKRLYEYYKQCGIKTELMKKDKSFQTGMSITLYSDLDTHDTYLSRGASTNFTKSEIDDAFAITPDMFLIPPEELGLEEKVGEMKLATAPVVTPSEKTEEAPEEKKEDASGESAAESAEKVDAPEKTEAAEKTETAEKTENGEKSDSAENKTEKADEPKVATYRYQESLAYYAIQKAEENHADLIMEYTPFTAKFPLEKINGIKILVISDQMLYSLTGFFPNSTDKALRSLVALSQKIKSKYYVVQQGESGVFVYDGRFYDTVTAPAVLRTVAKSQEKGMNSTFMGALAAEYLESKNILRACRFATIVSLMSRSKFGNLEKAPTKEALEAYAKEHGFDLYK